MSWAVPPLCDGTRVGVFLALTSARHLSDNSLTSQGASAMLSEVGEKGEASSTLGRRNLRFRRSSLFPSAEAFGGLRHQA